MTDAVYNLVITQAHGDYSRGDLISDPQEVADLLQDHPEWVVQIQVANPN